MVLEQELLPYLTWVIGYPRTEPGAFQNSALVALLATAFSLAVIALAVGFLVALVRHGPLTAGDITYRVVVALAIYVVILLFSGWFLQTGYREPGKLFFSVVLTATTYLVLLIALLVSAFSLPNDFKTKTIYTVVTKPVRAGDIVLGRILGFTIVGTLMLAIMSVIGYVFVVRTLEHTHQIDVGSLQNVVDADGKGVGKNGRA